MRVLIACEFSGIVREAFKAKGHDAWSCDLLPTEIPGQHIQDDVFKHLNEKWDLMIAHPECTYLCNSGVRWMYEQMDRFDKMLDAVNFFNNLFQSKIPKIVIESPIPHHFAKMYLVADYDQIIQPWQFGHGETKATCLWLKGLSKLQPTNIVEGRKPRVHHEPPSPDRWKNRSRTYPGIAEAMAEQWGTA